VAQFVEALCYKPESHSSNPESVIGIFHSHNTSGRSMSLGSTHLLTEKSTWNIYWGKGGQPVGLTSFMRL